MPESLNELWRKYLLLALGQVVPLAAAGDVVVQPAIKTSGANSYTVSVQGIASDVFHIEGRLTGETFYTVQAAINANQHYTFSGLYDELKLVKDSGSGTTAVIVLRYGR